MIKKIALFAALALVMSIFFSCSGDNETPPIPDIPDGVPADTADAANDGEPAANEMDDGLGEFNFDGYVFRTLTRWEGHIDVEEHTGELLNSAKYHRNRQLEERFGFTFSDIIVTDVVTSARNSIHANDNAFDLAMIRGPDAFIFAQQGLLHPMTALPHVNLDRPYWDQHLTSQWTVANRIFFAAGSGDLTSYYSTYAMLFNKNLASDLGIGDLYAMVREGRWTFDRFEEFGRLARRDLNGDGIYGPEDQHGFVDIQRRIPPTFWIAGGARSIRKDSNDIPYLTALEPRFLDVWFRLVDVTLNSGVWFHNVPNPNLHPNPLWHNIFRDGRALFTGAEFRDISTLRDMEIDFGIIPFPKLNENQENYYARLSWMEPWCIPIFATYEDLERTSVILEALTAASARTVIPTFIEIALKVRDTRDEQSAEMIDLIFASRVFDWGDAIYTSYLRDGIFSNIFRTQPDTVVSRLEAAEARINAAINNTVEAFMLLD